MPKMKKNGIAQKRKYMWKKNHNDNTTDGAESAQHTNKQAAITNETERAQDINITDGIESAQHSDIHVTSIDTDSSQYLDHSYSLVKENEEHDNDQQEDDMITDDKQAAITNATESAIDIEITNETEEAQDINITDGIESAQHSDIHVTSIDTDSSQYLDHSYSLVKENEEHDNDQQEDDMITDDKQAAITNATESAIDIEITNETEEAQDINITDGIESAQHSDIHVTSIDTDSSQYLDHSYSLVKENEEHDNDQQEDDMITDDQTFSFTCETSDLDMPVLGQTEEVETTCISSGLQILHANIKERNFLGPNFLINQTEDTIQIYEMYNSSPERTSVKLSVVIDVNFEASLFVHRNYVPKSHPVWKGLSETFSTGDSIEVLINRLSKFSVCFGIPDEQYLTRTPIGCNVSCGLSGEVIGYREADFCATLGNESYNSTIRSVNCMLLVEGVRCRPCQVLRRILYKRRYREIERNSKDMEETNYVHTRTPHRVMTRENLLTKISQQRKEIKILSNEVEKLRKSCKKEIESKGLDLPQFDTNEMKDFMASCQDDVEKMYPDGDCLQRLFWEQQCKYAKSGKNGMRWHPMIIRWCLYIRSKSAKAYDAARETGFIKLPSKRTLYDYSHFTKSALGQPDVIKVLHAEATKHGMLEENTYRSFAGILFDEIKIKEDLVYDKNSGELIGYCNLDGVGNQILELEKNMKNTSTHVAKSILVIMVRGVSTSLKFPLAGFATDSITADFLYPIIWKAVSILEVNLGLKVLFFTCDGASSNRKFFQIHKLPVHNNVVYFTPNPHDSSRNIYFVSDVPHLMKTTRNCFSNSYSHRKTRQMWKDGQDISWMHIVRLFEEHCEQNIYTPCPKLTRNHIDLSAYSCMKVNLAVQILSGTVANALEELYDNGVSETVRFIRQFNMVFDCLNVRSLFEGRNSRNPNLNPFKETGDPRIQWLRDDFLGYIKEWEHSVENRIGNFKSSEKAGMQLSYQTKVGLEMSIKSITECIVFMLKQGAEFVLTHNFNQDPLEQYFGHLRQKGGANNNPTVYDVRNTMTQLLTYQTQALGPKGNISQIQDENTSPVIDNSKLPKRKSKK